MKAIICSYLQLKSKNDSLKEGLKKICSHISSANIYNFFYSTCPSDTREKKKWAVTACYES